MKTSKLAVISIAFLISSCGLKPIINSSNFESSSFSSLPENNSSDSQNIPSSSEVSSYSSSSSKTSSSSSSSSSSKTSSSSSQKCSSSTSISDGLTITQGGSYTLTGTINGSIRISAPEDADVELVLNGVQIICSTQSPIFCESANELKLKLQSGTVNKIIDSRPQLNSENEDSTQGKGAIYSKADLKITSKGSLEVEANYNNGIHCTDDVTLKSQIENNSYIKITAVNHAVKGNDSITIESGKIILNSKGGSGLKTENTDISSKGNQRGTILISGGDIEINSCEDAVEAAYNVEINSDVSTPKLKILTSKFSSYTTGSISSGGNETATTLYFRASTNSYNYSAYFKNSSGEETWADATYFTSVRGNRSTYYYYKINKPTDATQMRVFSYSTSTTNRNESNARASTSYMAINSSFDTAVLSSSSSSLSVSQWTNYTSSQGGGPGGYGGPGGGMNDGNNDKAEYSAKGLKASNEIIVKAGNIDIKAYDDALHASRGEQFENGSTGLGNSHILGGNLSLYASDDGIHADNINEIAGGTIDITNSYEGVEGNIINFSGGYTKIYSTDDGINAANKAGLTPEILISGGVLDIQVYGGDVDGIDSNGNFTQTGGLVISKGGTSGMSNGLDTDGATKVNGGTLMIFGKPENTPSLGSGVTSYNLNASYAIGTYEVSNGTNTVTTTTKYAYNTVYVYSNESSRYTITKK